MKNAARALLFFINFETSKHKYSFLLLFHNLRIQIQNIQMQQSIYSDTQKHITNENGRAFAHF